MGCHLRQSKGQSVVELTLATGVLTLILLMGVRTSQIISKNFKHNYLDVPSDEKNTTQPVEIQYQRGLVFFKTYKELNTFKNNHPNTPWIFINKIGVLTP